MLMTSRPYQSIEVDFSLPEVITLISGKWKSRIIFSLLESDKKYSELKRDLSQASDRMLSKNLRDLLESEIIEKIVVSVTPIETKYMLSDSGRQIIPALILLLHWGEEFLNSTTHTNIQINNS